MGEVYRARDTRLGRVVAVKLVSSEIAADRTARERLAREAQLASSLNHPSIVTVFDIGEEDGHPYIVMELIGGGSLYRRLSAGPLKTREALEIACQVANGLAAAHSAGVVHRDLKPQNIMLTGDGRAKIVDFGLSKLTSWASGPDDLTARGSVLTGQNAVLGSVGYMAPEQVAGRAVDRRADQFALGVVLYEMLSGKRAFKRETSVQTMAAIIEDEPRLLFDVSPKIPEPVVAVVERCLAKQPERRYASTDDLARDLDDLRDSIASGSRSAPRLAPTRISRWPWVAAAVATLAALAAAAWLWGRAEQPQPVSLAPASRRLIVVLPFTNVTKDPIDEVFADGLVETLTSSLTQLERFQRTLRIVPTSEARRERVASAKEAHAAFGATLAITGSIQRGPSAVRVTLNLVDAVQLHQLSSRTISVAASQDAATQDSIADATAALLDLQLDPEARQALTAGGTEAAGAYEQYVQGRGYLQRFDRPENIDLAIDRFSRAVAADDRFALAYAGLGEAYWRKYEADKDPSWIDRAVDNCGQALKVDDWLAPVHVTLALIARGRGRYEEAVAVAGRAVQLDPVSSDGYRELGRAYEALNRTEAPKPPTRKPSPPGRMTGSPTTRSAASTTPVGRAAEAEAAYRRTLDLTPDNTRVYSNLGATLFALRRPEEAAAMWERSVAIRPTYAAVSNLGTYYFDRGRYADAARAFERAAELMPNDFRVLRNLGAALYWAPGERSKAAAAFQQAIALGEQARKVNPATGGSAGATGRLLRDGQRDPVKPGRRRPRSSASSRKTRPCSLRLAGVYEQLGERDAALTWLEKALAAGYQRDRVERSPSLAELRKDARYVRLTAK